MMVESVTIRIPASELLSCIWYSDGSGASGIAGVNLSDMPSDYIIEHIARDLTDKSVVVIRLKRVEP